MLRLLWIFPLIFLAGCAQSPAPAGVLRVAQENDASTLDPAKAYDTTSIKFARVLYRGLVEFDQNAKLYPELAKSWSISDKGKTYTFKLRPNIRFHDGTPLRSTDFRFAMERVLDPQTASDGTSFYMNIVGAEEWMKDRQGPRRLKNITGIECPDALTIRYRLKRAEATFLANLALPFSYAVPENYVRTLNKKGLPLSENPNGTGPFKLREWVHDGWLHLERNPDYFRKGVPKLQSVECQFGISPALQIMLFEQGNLDVQDITASFAPDFLRIKNQLPWKKYVENAPMMDIRYLALNNEIAPFNDVRVRKAISYAINRERITGFLTGRASPAKGALPPGMPAYNPTLKGITYNPQLARDYLRQSGFKDNPSAPLPLLYPSEGWYPKAAQSIQADLKAIGITVDISPLRFGDLRAKAGRRGQSGARMSLLGWVQDYPDPSNFLDPLFNSRSIKPVSSLNRSFYSNTQVDKLLDTGLAETDPVKRMRMYSQAEQMIVNDAPVVFLMHSQQYITRNPRVKGPILHPMWSALYEQLEVR